MLILFRMLRAAFGTLAVVALAITALVFWAVLKEQPSSHSEVGRSNCINVDWIPPTMSFISILLSAGWVATHNTTRRLVRPFNT